MFRRSRISFRRSGWIRTMVMLAGAVAAMVLGATWWFFAGNSGNKLSEEPITAEVIRAAFVHNVIDQGEVESSNNTEVKCHVPSRNSGGTELIWVIEEGTWVTEGEKLVELDSSAMQQERDQQEIKVNTSEALKAQAEADLAAAKIALTEYEDGTLLQEEQTILGEIFVAEENLSRAVQYARYSQRLAAKGYITAEQLKGDLFSVQKAQNDMKLAQKKLNVLRTYTKVKQLKTLNAAIDAATAKLESETKSHQLEVRELNDLETQIKNCTIVAPKEGQVVYNNRFSSRGNAEFVVEEGAKVREGQTIINIPDPSKMQVKAKINEARVTLVKPGMPVTIEVSALEREITGTVASVNPYSEPSSWSRGSVKEYAAFVQIDDPPKEIRPGLTTSVKIHVEQLDDVLQIPVQSLIDHYGTYYCLLQISDNDWQTREIKVGSTNDEMAVVLGDTLKPGEKVVMNPRRYPEVLQLPEVDPREIEAKEAERLKRRGPRSGGKPSSPGEKKKPAAGDVAAPKAEKSGGAG